MNNLNKLKSAPAAQVLASGSGMVIYLSDNPNFRAFWYGTNKLYANAIFFGSTLSRWSLENPAPKKNEKKTEEVATV